jgi:hypothetical protein
VLTRVHDAVARWLTCAKSGQEPTWSDIDAVNYNNSISSTPLLLSSGVSVVPPELLRLMFLSDAKGPALGSHADYAVRLFEPELRPLVLGRVVDLAPSQRTAVEQYLGEFERLRERSADWQAGIDEILEGLEAAGY